MLVRSAVLAALVVFSAPQISSAAADHVLRTSACVTCHENNSYELNAVGKKFTKDTSGGKTTFHAAPPRPQAKDSAPALQAPVQPKEQMHVFGPGHSSKTPKWETVDIAKEEPAAPIIPQPAPPVQQETPPPQPKTYHWISTTGTPVYSDNPTDPSVFLKKKPVAKSRMVAVAPKTNPAPSVAAKKEKAAPVVAKKYHSYEECFIANTPAEAPRDATSLMDAITRAESACAPVKRMI